MDYKKTVAALISMLDKYSIRGEEKDAVLTAIGVLSWASLAKNRIKNLKPKQNIVTRLH